MVHTLITVRINAFSKGKSIFLSGENANRECFKRNSTHIKVYYLITYCHYAVYIQCFSAVKRDTS